MSSFFQDRTYHEASQLNGFSGSTINRQSELRSETALTDARAMPEVRYHVLSDDGVLVKAGGADARFTPAEAEAMPLDVDSLVLLGMAAEGPRIAASLLKNSPAAAGTEAVALRALATEARLPPEDIAALSQASSYLSWHAVNRFCGNCGGRTEPRGGGVSRHCPHCGKQIFPRVDPVVIMLVIDGDRCLMGRQARFAPGSYSALAGFLEPGETMEEAVRREVQEEAGVKVGQVRYHSSQAWPFPHSLMLGCHGEALSTEIVPDVEELEDARWFDRDEVRRMIAGTHPGNLIVPQKVAIARKLIDAFAEWEG
ncbi:NAD+ diphosphatase [Faunimonas pinastri]|uniref:NAD(+) diphosphatase n=1 Tax=Faunimonas pinastri TaxID=1855383 RepID=A0A1H9HF15_9HYPH|nr:NAD(+) diphosphatase [Faunimonas pinastri]SEQ60887.1 NAD+ diphosphatase [Faunimonas pinastri]